MSVQVETSTDAPAGWDAYVHQHAAASAYHFSAAVRIARDAFGLHVFFLTAKDAAGNVVGILPLVEQSSALLGRYLISVPYFTYGGALANDDSIATKLCLAAGELGRSRRAAHVELRHTLPIEGIPFGARLDKVSMVLPLPATEEALSKQLGSKLRSQIKRAEREQVEVAWGEAQLLPDFYSVFAPTMHELGTPVYSKRFFETVLRALPDRARVLVVKSQGRVEAASIVVRHASRLEVPWAACTPEGKRKSINMRLYWEMLRFAVGSGAPAFDFGRSSIDAGTYKFKAQWGSQPMQLYWHYWMAGDAPLPKLNHSNPKFALAANLWRRMPLWCANLIGPHIARNLP
jgi:FemAB-related protein (PEP-CTERM system-associated)